MPFTQRLALMQQSNQISDIAHEKTIKLIELLTEKLGASALTSATTFVTHSAIAINRTLNNQALSELDEEVMQEIQAEANYERAAKLLKHIECTIEVNFNHVESTLILAHLCGLVEANKDVDFS